MAAKSRDGETERRRDGVGEAGFERLGVKVAVLADRLDALERSERLGLNDLQQLIERVNVLERTVEDRETMAGGVAFIDGRGLVDSEQLAEFEASKAAISGEPQPVDAEPSVPSCLRASVPSQTGTPSGRVGSSGPARPVSLHSVRGVHVGREWVNLNEPGVVPHYVRASDLGVVEVRVLYASGRAELVVAGKSICHGKYMDLKHMADRDYPPPAPQERSGAERGPSAERLSLPDYARLRRMVERLVESGRGDADTRSVAGLRAVLEKWPGVGEYVARLLAAGKSMHMFLESEAPHTVSARLGGAGLSRAEAERLAEDWYEFDHGRRVPIVRVWTLEDDAAEAARERFEAELRRIDALVAGGASVDEGDAA